MLARKFSYIVRDPRNMNRLLSLIIRIEFLRDLITRVFRIFKPSVWPVELDQEAMRHYQEITKIGYSELPRLSAQQLSDIHNHLKYKALYVRFMHGKGASYTHDAIPQGINMLEYDSLTVAQCPYLLELANSKLYIDIAQKILGCRPTISYLSVWYSNHRAASPKDTELFHRDFDDWRFIKVIVYLVDVDEDTGPHVYVEQSHLSTKLKWRYRYTDSAVEKAFADKIIKLTGPAGSSFMINTYGMHKGLRPTQRSRLVLQVVYSMNRTPNGPARPVISLPRGFDPYLNRIYCSAEEQTARSPHASVRRARPSAADI